MKRLNIAFITLFATSVLSAQSVFEAAKFSNTDIVGSARYMGVAGAFGALGGDASAIKDNPAALGVFRKSEISMTLNGQLQASQAMWGGQKTNDSRYGASIDNISLVFANKTWRADNGFKGLLNSNFSFGYNKLMNFNRLNTMKGNATDATMTEYMAYLAEGFHPDEFDFYNDPITDTDLNNQFFGDKLPWLGIMGSYGMQISPNFNGTEFEGWTSFLDLGEKVTPTYMLKESGAVNEYSFGWSGNISNRFFLGATLNWQTIYKEMNSVYSESFEKNGSSELTNALITRGNGFNLNLGLIAVPVDFLRLGFSFHTPMFYRMEQMNYGKLKFTEPFDDYIQSPDNYVDYRLQTPMQLNASVALLAGNKGFISAEYVYKNYKGMKLSDLDGMDYTYENEDINSMLNNVNTFKLGAEYKLTPNVALRAGYANVGGLMNSKAEKLVDPNSKLTDPAYFTHNKTNYITAGLGYRENNWYVDMAYTNRLLDEDYYAYNSNKMAPTYAVSAANVKTTNHNLVFTLGLRF